MAALVQTFPQQSGTVTMIQARPTSAKDMLPAQSQQPPYAAAQQPRTNFYAMPNNIGSAPVLYRAAAAPIQPYAFTSTPSLLGTNGWQPQQLQQQQQQLQQQQQQLQQQMQQQQQQMQQYGQQQQMQQQMQHSNNVRSSASTPSLPRLQNFDAPASQSRSHRGPASPSTPNHPSANSNSSSTVRYVGTRDDSTLSNGQGVRRVSATPRPQSAFLPGTTPTPQLSPASAAPARPSPERYRRPSANAAQHQKSNSQPQVSSSLSGSAITGAGHVYALNGGSNGNINNSSSSSLHDQSSKSSTPRTQAPSPLIDARRTSYNGPVMTGMAADDIQLHRQGNEDAKRFRRRSMPTLNGAEFLTAAVARRPTQKPEKVVQPAPRTPNTEKQQQQQKKQQKAAVMQSEAGSSESVASGRSNASKSSSLRQDTTVSATTTSALAALANLDQVNDKPYEPLRLISIPPRVSSSDAAASTQKPAAAVAAPNSDANVDTPPANAAPANAASASAPPTGGNNAAPKPMAIPSHLESPAMRHLNAINQKGGKLRSKTSKLRRAFSFGSAAELRKVAEESEAAASAKAQKGTTSQEAYDAEQDRIAQQQEEGGIGNSIYAGARIFTGSTDNLSISSTASSASIMIRKMGRGMKKSTRSLVGLFRPKSVAGAPGAEAGQPETTSSGAASSPSAAEATVSMVTVEAERERVNVNPDVHAQTSGGTSFPRLERNSIDASKDGPERVSSSGSDKAAPRTAMAEGDRGRAEVLAAVRKGILKNSSSSSSPVRSPADVRALPFELHNPKAISESPASSAPSTPNDDMQGHKRSGSVAIGGEDYFVSALRLQQAGKSGSSTPQGSMKRCATFSPRIVFHDTWPSQEYDRRGEIATCNRLTPMLAQQIKEELNSFKMEMEVHETSKIYTHFF